MFRQVFDPDNLFWRLISRGVDFVGLGLFWLLLCIPIATIGPATSALYYTVVKVFRQKEDHAFFTMWKSFRANLYKGCITTLICIPFTLLFAFFYSVLDQYKTTSAGAVMFVAYWIALVIPAGVLCWLFPILARFETNVKGCFRTAFFLTLRHIPSTFVVVLLNYEFITWSLEKWWPTYFAPVLCTLLCSLFLERIFPKYLSKEEKAVLEGRDLDEYEDEE